METTEKKVSHTPAPWKILTEGDEDSCIVRTVIGPGYGPRNLSEVVIVATGSYPDDVEAANAKLIAAAPELLEALQDAYMELYAGNSMTLEDAMRRMHPNADGLEKKMVAAIKKATE